MIDAGVHEAKTNLSKLLRRVELGEDAGVYVVPGDFNAPLTDDLLDALDA